jgi:predicted nucleotidyltransferase
MSSQVPDELLNRVVDYFHPRRVILFGSHARGDAGPDSDYDLLVILDDSAPREMLTPAAGFAARRGCGRAVDVIPCRESAFADRADTPGTLAYDARRDGVVVYDRHSG